MRSKTIRNYKNAWDRVSKTHYLFFGKMTNAIFKDGWDRFAFISNPFYKPKYICLRFDSGKSFWFDRDDIYFSFCDKFFAPYGQYLWIRKSALKSKRVFA